MIKKLQMMKYLNNNILIAYINIMILICKDAKFLYELYTYKYFFTLGEVTNLWKDVYSQVDHWKKTV